MARVDVVMPVRNGAAFIEEAIRSIIAQSECDWRLIILDHASQDGTAAIVDRYSREDHRIEVKAFDMNMTLSEVRNQGLDLCQAPYMMMHDADDVSLPSRMKDQLALLESRPDLVLVGGGYTIVDEKGASIACRTLPEDPKRVSTAFLFSNPIAQPTVMLRMDEFSSLGLRYGPSVLAERYGVPVLDLGYLAEDYLLFGQLAVLGLCANISSPVIRYRRHANGTSVKNFVRQMELSADVSRHLMELVAAHHRVLWHDPTPFCNHGARLYHDVEPASLGKRWALLERSILTAFGDDPGVRRELAFRRILSTRSFPRALARFARYATKHKPDSDEIETMKNIVKDLILRRPGMPAPLLRNWS